MATMQPRTGNAHDDIMRELTAEIDAKFYRDIFQACCDRRALSAVRGFLSDNGIESDDVNGFLWVRRGYCTVYDKVLLTVSEKGFNQRLLDDPECFQLLLEDF